MENIFIDMVGSGLEILVAMLFYKVFWKAKNVRNYKYLLGFLLVASINVFVTTFAQNPIVLPSVSVVIMFFLSFYFVSSVVDKIWYSSMISAILFASEMVIGFLLAQTLNIPINQIQDTMPAYIFGALMSKLFALFLVYTIKIIIKNNDQLGDRQFNSVMALMPIQSVILCFVVYSFTINVTDPGQYTFGVISVFISLGLVFIIMVVLNNQHKALGYKKEYELAQIRLKSQIDHYQKLYAAQQEVKSIRHSIRDSLIAISGMLSDGKTQEAINHIVSIHSELNKTSTIVDTGLPPVDAILNAKINKAGEYGVNIIYKVLIDGKVMIDQFDLAVIISNALENAIEGITRADTTERDILLQIASKGEYISIIVKNHAPAPMNENFQTSKPDKSNHGFGIPQMQTIADKYNGDIQPEFDQESGVFILLVLLRNQHL